MSPRDCGDVSVMWQNLTIKAHVKKSHLFTKTDHTYKTIIDNASGLVKAGNLVALLGASGCGKTSLMSVLAYRNTGDLIIDGNIKIGGQKIGSFVKNISGYVFQENMFYPVLTVTEHLNFVVQLKLGDKVSAGKRMEMIINMLITLGLYHLKDTVIVTSKYGKEKTNLSGGELKRLSVATELLTDPPLLFCDEPTTGLDSYSAYRLVSIMRDMCALKNKTIICSIHQPNDDIFKMFHQIILLYDGKVAFMGSQHDAIDHFKSHGHNYNQDGCLAEFLIKSLSTDCIKANSMCNNFYTSSYWYSMQSLIADEISNHRLKESLTKNQINHTSWLSNLWVLTHREFVCILRSPSIELIHIVQTVFFGLTIGLCMNNSVTYTQIGMQNLQGVIFSLVAESGFPSMYCMLNYIPHRVPIFYREYINGTNSSVTFIISNALAIVPTFIVCPVLLTLLIYWFASLKPTLYAVFMTCLICIVIANATASFGILLSVVFKTEALASIVTVTFDYLFTIFSGVYIQLRTVPAFMSWMQYISWVKYGVEALYILQLRNVHFIECSSNGNFPCFRSGKEVLRHFDFNENDLWRNILILFLMYLTLISISCIFFSVRMNRRNV